MLTSGHDFQAKYPQNTLEKFKEYLQIQASQEPELENFFSLFNDRVIILDTELENQALNRPQLEPFLKSIGLNITDVIDDNIKKNPDTLWRFICKRCSLM